MLNKGNDSLSKFCFRANLFIKLQEKGGKIVRAQPNRHKAWDQQTSKSLMLYKSCPPVIFTAVMSANCSRCIHSLANLTHGAHLHTWKIYTLIYGTEWFLPYSHHKSGFKKYKWEKKIVDRALTYITSELFLLLNYFADLKTSLSNMALSLTTLFPTSSHQV